MTEFEAYELIEKLCKEIMHPSDYHGIDKSACALIDSYDPTLNECCVENCPALKDIKKYLEKSDILDEKVDRYV